MRFSFIYSILIPLLLTIGRAYGQCPTGCDITLSSGGGISSTAANQTICITASGTYSITNNHPNIKVLVCAPDVIFSNVQPSQDTLNITTYAKGTVIQSAVLNAVTHFTTMPESDLTIVPGLNPGKIIYFTLGAYSSMTTGSLTSNAGTIIRLGKNAELNIDGDLKLQAAGLLFNQGRVKVTGELTVQGGVNAMNNYCGFASIEIGGNLTLSTGSVNNAGYITSNRINFNGNVPVYMHAGSTIRTEYISSVDRPDLIRGDSIPDGDCALFELDGNFGSWNSNLTNSSKINFCRLSGTGTPRLGAATIGCVCESDEPLCIVQCTKPDAGNDTTVCASTTINLKDAGLYQKWLVAAGNPGSTSIDPRTGVVTGNFVTGIYQYILFDTTGTENASCLDTVTVTVNKQPSASLSVRGGTFCDDQTNATVVIEQAEPGVTYSVLSGTRVLANAINNGNSAADLSILIHLDSFALGTTTLNFRAAVDACTNITLSQSATVIKNKKPSTSLAINGGYYCSNQTNATLQVTGAEPGVRYKVLLNDVLIAENTNTGTQPSGLTINVPVSSLASGMNVVQVEAEIAGCGSLKMDETDTIYINTNPSSSLTFTGSTVCSDDDYAYVTVNNAQPGVVYSVMLGSTVIGNASHNGTTPQDLLIDNIPVASLNTGNNTVRVRADIAGCATVTLNGTRTIVKNSKPDASLLITGGTVCSNATTTQITIHNAEPGVTYKVLLAGNELNTGTNTVNTPTTITIPISVSDLATGMNIISVQADIEGCTTVDLTDTAGVILVPNPSALLAVTGGVVCSEEVSAKVVISGTAPDVVYSVYRGTTKVGEGSSATGGELEIDVLTSSLANGLNVINVRADIAGCAIVSLTDTANIILVPLPSATLSLTGGTICSLEDSATVTIQGAQPNVTYELYIGSTQVGSARQNAATAGLLEVKIGSDLLSDGINTVTVKAVIPGCRSVDLDESANVVKVPNPDAAVSVEGNIVCSNEASTKITIRNSNPGVTYTAYVGSSPVGQATNTNTAEEDLEIVIDNARLTNGTNSVSVRASISGCAVVDLEDTVVITKVPRPSSSLAVNGSSICASSGTTTSVTIVNATSGVTYTAYLGTTQLGANTRTGGNGNLVIDIPTSLLNDGVNTITVNADIDGCGTVTLANSASVTLDPALSSGAIIASNNTICSGTSPLLQNDVLPSGGLPPLAYTWQYSVDGVTWTNIAGSNTPGPLASVPSITSDAQYRRIVRSATCADTSNIVSIVVTGEMDGGDISASTEDVCNGAVPGIINSVELASGGTGTEITYQWQLSVDGNDWSDIVSANDPDYTPDALNADTYFRRRATNGNGSCDTTYAGPVLISLYLPLTPGAIQTGDTTVCDGSDIIIRNVTLPANGSPGYSFVWQRSVSPFTDWEDIASSNSSSVSYEGIGETTRFRRVVLNSCENDTTDGYYEVLVLPNLVTDISFEPIPVLLCNTDTLSIVAKTANAGARRRIDWFYNGTGFLLPAGQPDSVYKNQNIWRNNDVVKVIVYADPDKLCTTPSDSAELVLNVNMAIAGNTLTGSNQQACEVTDIAEITGSAATGTLAAPPYIWQISENRTDWENIPGANAQNYTPEITTGLVYYRRIAVSAGACPNDTSVSSIELRLDGQFDPGELTADPANICQGVVPTFTVTSPTGGLRPYSYQWERSTDNNVWVAINGATDSVYTSSPLGISTYFRRRVITATDVCEYLTPSLLIKVDTAVISSSNTIAEDQSLCEGEVAATISGSRPTGGIQPVTYQWISSPDGIDNWTDVAGATGQHLDPGAMSSTTYFRRIITSTGACSSDTSLMAVELYVDPALASGSIDQHESICRDESVSLTVSDPTGGSLPYSYQWQSSTDNNEWNDLTGETSATLQFSELSSSLYVRRIVISALAKCSDTTIASFINVDQPIDQGTNDIGSGEELCFGTESQTIVGSAPVGGLEDIQYQWISSPTGTDNWTVISGAVGKDYSPGLVTSTTYYKRIVTSTGACKNDSSAVAYRLFIDPLVNPGYIGDEQQFCNRDLLYLDYRTEADGGSFINYTWILASDTTNPVWEHMPNSNRPDLSIAKENLPEYETYYFRRIASSLVCEDTTEAVGIYPCLNPDLTDDIRYTCQNAPISNIIVGESDYSRNGGGLIARSVPVVYPQFGVIEIDTVNNLYTYTPNTNFIGEDSVVVMICDTSKFKRCSQKRIAITVSYINTPPLVRNDSYWNFKNQPVFGNILDNDSDADNDSLYVAEPYLKTPEFGTVYISSEGDFEYIPEHDFVGTDTLIVNVCDFSSDRRCNQTLCRLDTVYFEIKPNVIFVPDGFSPNGDNIHDRFVIKTDIPPSGIVFIVYNRWGNIVYENKNYQNDWDGTANRGLVIGSGVPDGTYYIYYNVNDGEAEGFKYITINR